MAILADVLVTLGVSLGLMSLSANQPLPAVLIAEGVAMLLCLLVLAGLLGRTPKMTALLLFTALLAVVWSIQYGAGISVMGLVGFGLFAVRRIRYVQDVSDDDVQVGRLVWDLGFMTAGALIIASGGYALEGMKHAVFILFAAAAVCRVGALRSAQIARAKRKGVADVPSLMGPFGGTVGILCAGLLAFVGLPEFRMVVLATVAVALLSYWMIRSRAQVLSTALFAAIFALFLWFINRLQNKKRIPLKPVGVKAGHQTLPEHMIHPLMLQVPTYVWLMLMLIILGVSFLMIQSKRTRHVPPQDPGSPVVERVRLSAQPRSRYRSRDGIGGLLVRWLEQEERLGRPLHRGETTRAYWERVQQSEPAYSLEVHRQLSDVVRLYESERYGEKTVSPSTVSALDESLRKSGVLGRPSKSRVRNSDS